MARKSRSLDEVKLPPWQMLAFTDLHLSARTLDRALNVLRIVREAAVSLETKRIVFLGDWWDARGVLPVRLLDPVIDEFHRYREAKLELIIIPGNHDQLSENGRIHGVRIFEAFSNIRVATDPIIWPEHKIAFLPWRESPEEQAGQFDLLEGTDWTVFAHAEVQGARTNQKHVAIGRVSLSKIAEHARACYCGHYHMRQQLGDRTWYLGSPFEQTFGEMGDPKGLALIRQGQLEPTWLELTGFPRHRRITYNVPFEITAIQPVDIVEVYAQPDVLGTDDFKHFISTLPAKDVRPLPLKAEVKSEDDAPVFALTLEQAIDNYVDQEQAFAESKGVSLLDGTSTKDLTTLGRAILAELPEARTINPIVPRVSIVGVEVQNFCAIEPTLTLNLRDRGLLLLKGPVGVGKTALADSITWCLFDETSPRKAGSQSSTFRGDEIIFDDAKTAHVRVVLALDNGTEVSITREKTRGKRSVVTIEGLDGFDSSLDKADAQACIQRVIGLDYDLWRTCVSLGQGNVGNFVTDADKKRKELLSIAFGLTACPGAVKFVRDRAKPLKAEVDKIQGQLAAEQHAFSTLEKTDYTDQIRSFDERKAVNLSRIRAEGEHASTTIQTCDQQLALEPQWVERKKALDEATSALTGQLVAMGRGQGSGLDRELGAAEAERSLLQAQLAKEQAAYSQLEAQIGKPFPCPSCGRPMDTSSTEQLLSQKADEIERITRGIHSFTQRIQNTTAQLENFAKGGEQHRQAIETQLAENRKAGEQIATALAAFAKLRANKEEAERRLIAARASWTAEEAQTNPFAAQQERLAIQLESLEAKIEDLKAQGGALTSTLERLEFWEQGFGPKGLPVLVLRTVIHELEMHANKFLAQLVGSRLFCRLLLEGDDLQIQLFEQKRGAVRERRYEQLSGGQRRCIELAFSPFALSEMIFARCGVRIDLIVIDELTTHLGADEKPAVCEALRKLDRGTVLVIDHDVEVQGEFDVTYSLSETDGLTRLEKERVA